MDLSTPQDRLARVPTLGAGSHRENSDAMCVMEAVAFVAGEPWSDHPACACPVISAFLRAWNDGLPDDERDRLLRPLIPRLLNTRSTTAVEQRRADLALDWFVRVNAPAWLDLSEALSVHASALRALPPLHSRKVCVSALPVLRAASTASAAAWDAAMAAAWDAARAAAWDAAMAAAWDAARAAARDAAWDAAWAAARDAAWAAAWDAAWAAAWAAAWDAAWAAVEKSNAVSGSLAADEARHACVALFAPTRVTLQRSALELVDAMLAVTPAALATVTR